MKNYFNAIIKRLVVVLLFILTIIAFMLFIIALMISMILGIFLFLFELILVIPYFIIWIITGKSYFGKIINYFGKIINYLYNNTLLFYFWKLYDENQTSETIAVKQKITE